MMTDEVLFKKYIEQLNVKPHNTNELFVIGIVGLVGSGKSTVARLISDKTGIFLASNDAIRRFLNENGIEGVAPAQTTVQYIAVATSKYLYEHNVSQIIDNDLLMFHAQARQNAEAYGAKFLLLNVTCPDEIIRQRIIERTKKVDQGDASELSRAGIDEYEARKALHQTQVMPEFDLKIDTSLDLGPQVDAIVKSLISKQLLDL